MATQLQFEHFDQLVSQIKAIKERRLGKASPWTERRVASTVSRKKWV
jgi:hypothetical protein